ncbi:hypothetical protein NKH18_49395 [Streptomyces sp. M10(2022)]
MLYELGPLDGGEQIWHGRSTRPRSAQERVSRIERRSGSWTIPALPRGVLGVRRRSLCRRQRSVHR